MIGMRLSKRVGIALLAVTVVGVLGTAARRVGPPVPTAADLRGPWQSPDAALIIDPYHGNDYTIADLERDPRIVGIIHKASEGAPPGGMFIVDQAYRTRRDEAIAAGYKWGSFHLGRPGDPEGQADRYFNLTRPGPNEVIALDLEQGGGAMSMVEAARFIRRLHVLTHRYPLIYGGRNTVGRPVAAADRALFKQCPLWIVDTRDEPRGWPASLWPAFTIWQFSSELRYRYPFVSVDPRHKVSWDLDIDYYAGSRTGLRAAWPFTVATQ